MADIVSEGVCVPVRARLTAQSVAAACLTLKEQQHASTHSAHSFFTQVIYLQFFPDKNYTATYQRIERIIKKNIEEANRVFNLAEFYGKGQNIHKGIEFKLTDYFIDTDEKCGPRKRQIFFFIYLKKSEKKFHFKKPHFLPLWCEENKLW